MYARIFGILSISFLTACGGGGSNPITGGSSDDGVVTTPGADPNTQSNNTAFLFDPANLLTANQFTFTPGATAAGNSITINNLPFDNVSSQGGSYQPRAGVILPSGQVFDNAAAGGDPYLAVIVQSPSGTGALAGVVATDVYQGFGYGGAYISRPSSGLPATRPAAYTYTGAYNGVRVIRQTAGPNNAIQLTTGTANITVDLQDFDLTGAFRGFITGRQLFDENGNPIPGALAPIELVITDINQATATTTGGTTRTINTTTGANAQSGSYVGMFSGPNGGEIVGYIVVEGDLSNIDPNFVVPGGGVSAVTGREVGGFVAVQNP